MKLSFEHGEFIFDSGKDISRTTSYKVAAGLREYADKSAKLQLGRVLIERKPWPGRIRSPKGKVPRDFQIPATKFFLERNRSYGALDPGLGKGVITWLLANALADRPFVVIVPPYLVLTAVDEYNAWSLRPKRNLQPWVLDPKSCTGENSYWGNEQILIVPDSIINRKAVQDEIRRFNWLGNGVLVVDEAHRYKNGKAKRTRALLGPGGLAKSFVKVIWLSGTPIPNGRPIELYPLLSRQAPATIDFMNKVEFGLKYCNAKCDVDGGWDFSGASNLKELKKRLAPFMLRIRKTDVLKDLPPKTEEMVILADKLPASRLKSLDAKLLREHSPNVKEMREALAKLSPHKEQPLATYRRMLGKAKVPKAIEFIQGQLESSDEKILIFAYHTAVICDLAWALREYNPAVITGNTPTALRHELVKDFQTNSKKRIVIGNYLACGTGFTLTKATRVIFVEFSWVPADNDQASDRAHRIGQRDNVFVQYLVFKNSLDRVILETNLRKRENIQELS